MTSRAFDDFADISLGGGYSEVSPERLQLNWEVWFISFASQMTKDRQLVGVQST